MKLVMIVSSFFAKLAELIVTAWGWVVFAFFAVINFYEGFKFAFISVAILIIMDMISGIWCAIARGKYARSELARDTFSKIAFYGAALVAFAHMEMLNSDGTWVTNIIASAICATEFWSFSGNALIINPNLHFFKLMRPALIGEIARKLNITEDEVKEALDKNKKLIDKKTDKQ